MTKNYFLMGALIAMAGGLSSCGGDGGQPLQGQAVNFVLGNFNTVVVTQLPQSNSVPTLPGNGGLITASTGDGIRTMAAGTCETTTPTTTIDADGDQIAKTKASVFNCTDLSNGGTTYTRTGTMTVTDGNDSVAGMIGGMRVDFALDKFNYASGTSANEGSFKGYWYYYSDGSSLISKSDFSEYNKYDTTTSPDYAQDYTYTYTWDWKHTPNNFNSAWTTGSVAFEGTYTLNGKFTNEVNGVHSSVTGTFSVKYHTSNLLFDNACAKWFKSGSIWVDDTNGNVFETRYNYASATLYIN